MSSHPLLRIFAALVYSSLIGVAVAFKLSANTHTHGYSRLQQLSMAGGRFSNEIVVVGDVGGVIGRSPKCPLEGGLSSTRDFSTEAISQSSIALLCYLPSSVLFVWPLE
jgi:hypothetical protein